MGRRFACFFINAASLLSILQCINSTSTNEINVNKRFTNFWSNKNEAGLKTQFVFEKPFSNIPVVNAWVEDDFRSNAEYSVKIADVDTTKFDLTVTKTGADKSSWDEVVTIHYKVTEDGLAATATEHTINLYGNPLTTQPSIPPAVWAYAPAIVQPSPNIIEMMGQQVHLSTVKQMLTENTGINFPLTHATSAANVKLQLLIRADTVYMDDTVTFVGLKSIRIIAREIISSEKSATFKAPEMCETLSGNSCGYLGKAGQSSDGRYGKSGIASPTVEFYAYQENGEIDIFFYGSDGNKGEDGGDGAPGQDNNYESPALSNSESCDKDCGDITKKKHYKGKPGPNGGDGEDGRRSGRSGSGGDSNPFTLHFQNFDGLIKFSQNPGSKGVPAEHGSGGRGGQGGTGGCGKECHNRLVCAIVCWPMCEENTDCGNRGDPGVDGKPGRDGLEVYGTPLLGNNGVAEQYSISSAENVKSWFVNDDELLKLVQRHGEALFQRSNNEEAHKVFSFLLYAADEASVLYQDANYTLNLINQGFDYYGNDQAYAPDLDWSFLKSRTDSLMAAGKSYEDAYNTIMEDIEDIMLVSSAMEFVVSLSIETEDQQLANQEVELKSAKNLYVKALKQIELTMKGEMLEINVLVPLVIVKEKVEELIAGIPGLLGGIAGFVKGLVFLNPVSAFNGVMQVFGVFNSKPECQVPKITEAADTLQEKLDFGYEWERINPEEFDFSSMDASAVPLIMLSELGKNKASLFHELECLFQDPDSNLVKDLERVINDFYRDAAVRIALIDKLMNIDVQLKTIGKNRKLLSETQATLDAAVNLAQENIAMEVKLSFSDYLFNLYQTQENNIMRSIYELSKAYQFSCLWDFNALENYNQMFSDIVITSNTGSLQGMFELQMLQQDLENQRDVFLNLIASSSGPTSHSFNSMWEFNKDTHPEVIESLRTTGQFTVGIELDSDDVATARCQSCYNARLGSLYVELIGNSQPKDVPKTIHIKVAHMGDSSFLIPLDETSQGVVYLQQTPENVDGGHVMSFDTDNLIKSIQDPYLEVKFLKSEHIFCDDAHSFFGAKPCKSPYASYVITVPRSDTLVCSKDPNDLISGTNCQDLDFTKFEKVRIYSKIDSWSDYPVQPDVATMKSLIKNMKAASNTE